MEVGNFLQRKYILAFEDDTSQVEKSLSLYNIGKGHRGLLHKTGIVLHN